MFPESFAEKWIDRLTRRGDYVLDPFCGRGTAPFQALLMGRNAVASDINPVAYCVSRAKTNSPSLASVRRRITILEREFELEAENLETERRKLPVFFRHAYRLRTLRQLLFLRHRLKWRRSDGDCMIAALVLGSLHGESNRSLSYLSNQMPRTISTKPDYSIRFWRTHGYKPPQRDVFELLRKKLNFRYESSPPNGHALMFHEDFRELPRLIKVFHKPIKCAITSPPYMNVTNYEEDQWLRIWFLGGSPKPTYGKISKDDRHLRPEKYWDLISDIWRVLGLILHKRADVVIRIGGKNLSTDQIVNGLVGASVFSRRTIKLANCEISEIKKKQTDSFRPGTQGCSLEVDCHFQIT